MAKKQIILDQDTKDRIVEKAKLTQEERFLLDAYIVSKENAMEKLKLAYSLSRKKEPTKNALSLEQLMYRWLNLPKVQYYIEDREVELFGAARKKEGAEDKYNVIRSKDETIEELNILASSVTDANKKADLLLKLADLQQWKKKEEEDKESRITYYMQVKCSKCPIYLKNKADKVAKSSTK